MVIIFSFRIFTIFSFVVATKEEEKQDLEEERNTQLTPLRKSYFCADCDQQLMLTSTEILKHKKTHLTNR